MVGWLRAQGTARENATAYQALAANRRQGKVGTVAINKKQRCKVVKGRRLQRRVSAIGNHRNEGGLMAKCCKALGTYQVGVITVQ